MGDRTKRLKRLYDKLLQFGLPCHVLDTRYHLPNLDNPASSGTIVGVGYSAFLQGVAILTHTTYLHNVTHQAYHSYFPSRQMLQDYGLAFCS